MKVSLKVEYACRVLAQLARSRSSKALLHIDEMASAEAIPANYLVQILNDLRNAGLIISRRGKQGGYALARDAAEISLADVLKAIDGEILEFTVSESGESGQGVKRVWSEVAQAFEKNLEAYKVNDILYADAEGMYFI